ncbi:MAG: PAS domain-containing protein [Spirochaetia bacterium]|nr:PAS domain-containing protein [Spirochaetia bacterium]
MKNKVKAPSISADMLSQFKAFLKAFFTDLYTYNIFKNSYIIFGFFAGLQVPIAAVMGHIYGKTGNYDESIFNHITGFFSHWIELHLSYPLFMGTFDIATIALALIFGGLGTMQKDRDKKQLADILDHVHIGILMIDRNFEIQSEYSAVCSEIFGKKNLAGIELTELLFPGKEGSQNFLTNFLEEAFDHEKYVDEEINDHNPLNILEYDRKDGSSIRSLQIEFYRVWNDVNIKKIMVHIEDITETVTLRKKMEKEGGAARIELDKTAQILDAGPERFQEFAIENNNTLKEIKASLRTLFAEKNIAKLDNALLLLSNFRAKASELKLSYLKKNTDALETTLHEIKNNFPNLKPEDAQKVVNSLEELKKDLKEDFSL